MGRRFGAFSVAAGILLAACSGGSGGRSRSTEEIQAEFDDIVARSIDCTSDDECVWIRLGCPLPCGVAIRVDQREAVERRARELETEYDQQHAGECGQGCSAQTPKCQDFRCTSSQ